MGCLMSSYQLISLQLLLFYSVTSAALCSHEQSSALLQFKQLFSFNNDSSSHCYYVNVPFYPKMMHWKESSDCCSWDGVTCDTVTGHVIGLDLSCSWLYGNIPSNTSLFHLRHLQSLNLAFNNFNFSQISAEFSRLSSLAVLNLSNSKFEGQTPSEISHLSKLVLLDLSSYYIFNLTLEAPVLERLVQNLTRLRELTLDYVNLSTIIPNSLSNLSSSLTSLSLSDCGMQGNFPDHIFSLPNLKTLYLWGNINLTVNFPKFNWSSPLEQLAVSGMNFSRGLPDSISNLKSLRYLILSSSIFFGLIPASIGNLTQLTYLDLSYNSFIGSIPDTLGNLKKLSYLSVTSCQLDGLIHPSIGNLTQLIRLDLSYNSLVGPIPPSLGNLRQLTHLDLSNNNFSCTIPDSFVNLKQLSYLDIESNQLIGPITSLLSELPNLVDIRLYNNSFNGTIQFLLFNLPLLEYIDLGSNQFSGHIEEIQSNSLQIIYLDGNRLHGSIPSSIFELVNLTALYLSSNDLSGSLELSMFAKLKNLERLGLSYNSLSVSTTSKVNSSFPQLKSLLLSACNISEFPDILRKSSKSLEHLDLSNNKIQGQIPNWMYDIGKDSLYWLNLSQNFLISLEQIPWKNVDILDLRSNLLQGPLPNPPPYLTNLLLSNNRLSGSIPHLICNLSTLEIIDLSNNSLTGNIPKCFGNISNSLQVIDLRKNRLYGTIPQKFAKCDSLKTLNFNDNELEGQVPRSLVNCKMLEVLDIGNNNIKDIFPYWLGNLPELRILILRSNNFYGFVQKFSEASNKSFSQLRVFDLSNNNFNGSLPVWYFEKMKAMMNIDEGERQLQYMGTAGHTSSAIYYYDSIMVTVKGFYIELGRIITIFTSIDLSNNNFDGKIPEIIEKFHALHLLNLSHNNLIGFIPSSLGNLVNLEALDLSYNKFIGEIPWKLTRLNFLQILNLSENQLTGSIPRDNHFDTFSNTSYVGNLGLCGFPLSKKCDIDNTQQPLSTLEDDGKSTNGFGWKVVIIGYGCGVALGVIMGYLVLWIGKPQWVIDIVAYWILRIVESLRKGEKAIQKCGGK